MQIKFTCILLSSALGIHIIYFIYLLDLCTIAQGEKFILSTQIFFRIMLINAFTNGYSIRLAMLLLVFSSILLLGWD